VIISDEIHSDLIMPPHRHTPIATLGEAIARRTITFFAPSKTFNLAGLATSYAVTPDPALRRLLRRELDASHVEPNLFGTVALTAAYTSGEEWLREAIDYIAGNMDYVADFIAREFPCGTGSSGGRGIGSGGGHGIAHGTGNCGESGRGADLPHSTGGGVPLIRTRRSEGTYMMWLDCRGLGLEQAQLTDLFINRARLGLNDGAMFGPGGEGFMRINLATSRAIVERAMRQLAEAILQIRG